MSEPSATFPAGRPFVAIDPAMQFGRATLNHTRLTVETVAGFVAAGDPVELVADEYEITRADVLVCCWYVARYGTRRWRERWGQWAAAAESELWHGRYQVADPPVWPRKGRKP